LKARKKITALFFEPRFPLRIIFSFLFWIFVSVTCSFSQGFHNTRFTTKDGLPSNTVYSSIQDHLGYIWFSTEYGVSRFNGFRFENFNQQDGLSDNDVFKVAQDSKNRIWFLTSNGTLSYYLNGKIYNPKTDRVLGRLVSVSYFNGFIEDAKGNLWFSTHGDGVYILNANGQVRHIRPLIDMPGSFLSSGIWLSSHNDVMAFGKDGVINLSKKPGEYAVPFEGKQGRIEYVLGRKDGSVVVAQNHRLFVLKPDSTHFRQIPESVFTYERVVSCMVEDADGDLWISTLRGLHQFEQSFFDRSHYHVYLRNRSLSGFMPDRQNNLWVSSINEGVFLINDRNILYYGKSQGMPEVPVSSIFSGKEGVWFGTDSGGIGLIDREKIKLLPNWYSDLYYGRGRIRSFQYSPDQSHLWVVSENGLFQIENQQISSHFPVGTKSICFDSQGNLLLGNSTQVLSFQTDALQKRMDEMKNQFMKKGKPYPQFQDFPKFKDSEYKKISLGTRVYGIKEDKDNTLWFATNSGLFSLQYNKTLYHKPFDELLGMSFQSIEILSDGTIALACNGYGVVLVKKGKVSIIGEKQGLTSNYIKNLHQFGTDSLWACTPHGLNLLIMKDFDSKPIIEKWTEENGLISENLIDITFRHDTAYMASLSEVIVYPGFNKNRWLTSPPVRLEKITVNGVMRSVQNTIEVPEDSNQFSIWFVTMDYRNIGKSHYRYRLDEELEWRQTSGNEIQLGALKAGDHVLEIQVRLPGEEWSASQKLLTISVNNPFYTNRLFLFLISLFLGAGAVAVWYSYRLLPRRRHLQESENRFFETQKSEPSFFVLGAFHTLQNLVATQQNETGIDFISRFKILYRELVDHQKKLDIPITKELEVIDLYLETLNFSKRTRISIDKEKVLQQNPERFELPPLFLANAMEMAFGLIELSDPVFRHVHLVLAEIGTTLQFVIEHEPPDNSLIFPDKRIEEFRTKRRHLEKTAADWNEFHSNKIEFFATGFERNQMPSLRIQIWIQSRQ